MKSNGRKIPLPKLTADDEFLSATQLGILVYRIPAPHTFLNMPMERLSTYATLRFDVSVHAFTIGGAATLSCKVAKRCRLTYSRYNTPTLYYLSPPVVYFESRVALNFHPYSTARPNEDLAADEMPFLNAKINDAHISFADTVDSDTDYYHWRREGYQAVGVVGDQPISKPVVKNAEGVVTDPGVQ